MTLRIYRSGLWLNEVVVEDAGFAVRGSMIVGSTRVVVWDTLTHPRDMQPVLSLIGNKPLTVVYSHADWDHVWGTADLTYERVIAHTASHDRFVNDVPVTLREKQAAQPGVWDAVQLVAPTELFSEHMTIDLGNITLELFHLPGHTADCIVGLIPAWGILLAGDTVETPLPVVNADSPIDTWIHGLETWAAAHIDIVIPAHGTIGGQELIRQNIAYLQGLCDGSSVVPAELDNFYCETHTRNVALATSRASTYRRDQR